MQLEAKKWIKNYQSESLSSRLTVYYTYSSKTNYSFADDVLHGLSSMPKFLSPKYFYDKTGSDLFEMICCTDEYYVTRTETSILQKYADEIICFAGKATALIELGSGASIKTKFLIDSMINKNTFLHYLPIDVSPILIGSSNQLIDENPKLKISGIISEYESGIGLANYITNEPKLFIFLGSSIGNFDLPDGKRFIKFISDNMTAEDHLLIGFDMVKDKDILHEAYNDRAGVTAAFNLNLLYRINSELGGNFDMKKFEHQAFFNDTRSRIEMHLVSKEKQNIRIGDLNEIIHFAEGESIHTENSYKFTGDMINDFALYAGLQLVRTWTDSKNYFSLCLFKLK